MDVVEVCRFITGGYQFIDNRAFFEGPCDILLSKEHIFFKNIQHRFSITRSDDWGWILADDNTFVTIYSFDRRLGQRLFDTPIQLPDYTRSSLMVAPLASLQLDNQLNKVYDVVTCETISVHD